MTVPGKVEEVDKQANCFYKSAEILVKIVFLPYTIFLVESLPQAVIAVV